MSTTAKFTFNPSIFPTTYETDYKASLESCKAQFKALETKLETPTIDNTLKTLDSILRQLDNISTSGWVAKDLITDPAIRALGEKACEESEAVSTQITLSSTIYGLLKGIDKSSVKTPADKRALELYIRDFEDAGAHLPDDQRAKLQELQDKAVKQSIEFAKNINEGEKKVEIKASALEGLPADYLESHKPDDNGNVTLTTQTADVKPVLDFCSDRETRRKLYTAWRSIGHPKNEPVLRSLLETSAEIAKLTGYPTYAHKSLKNGLVSTPEQANEFVEGLSRRLKAAAEKEMQKGAELIGLKREEMLGCDTHFMNTQLTKDALGGFDPAAAREYFQFGNVQRGLFGVFEDLFSIRFKEQPQGSLPVWHESVRIFDLYDAPTVEGGEGRVLGRVYLDLHPRKGKYNHACAENLVRAEKGVSLPEAALICNFGAGEQALMTADEVRTMFHELGHCLHVIIGAAHEAGEYRRFGSFGVELDFVEGPSQMLEFWTQEPEVLQRFAKNKKGEVIPAEMVKKLAQMEEIGKAVTTRRQLFYAKLSLGYYTLAMNNGKYPDDDTSELYNTLLKEWCDFGEPEGAYFQLDFGHLAGGYDARYYGYQWALSIAHDLAEKFERQGWMNKEVAMHYRKQILEPGFSKDGSEMIESFLGRPTNQDAYLKWLEKDL